MGNLQAELQRREEQKQKELQEQQRAREQKRLEKEEAAAKDKNVLEMLARADYDRSAEEIIKLQVEHDELEAEALNLKEKYLNIISKMSEVVKKGEIHRAAQNRVKKYIPGMENLYIEGVKTKIKANPNNNPFYVFKQDLEKVLGERIQ